jgi:hypothetical protein
MSTLAAFYVFLLLLARSQFRELLVQFSQSCALQALVGELFVLLGIFLWSALEQRRKAAAIFGSAAPNRMVEQQHIFSRNLQIHSHHLIHSFGIGSHHFTRAQPRVDQKAGGLFCGVSDQLSVGGDLVSQKV